MQCVNFTMRKRTYFRQHYYEAIDLADRFQQPGYTVYCPLESLLLRAASKENDFKNEFDCPFYKDDFQHSQLWKFNIQFQRFDESSKVLTMIGLIHYLSTLINRLIVLPSIRNIC